MADVRPTLSELVARLEADLSAALPGIDVSLPRALHVVLLRAFAGSIFEAWGHLQAIATDAVPDTATGEVLERWAALFGVSRVQGVKAYGFAAFTEDPAWVPVAVGARLVRADGFEYVVSGAPLYFGGWWISAMRATEAGAAGNFSGVLRLVEPSPGIGDVSATPILGVDRESDSALRARLLDVLRAPPQGGTAADFRRWMLAVPGVTRAWVGQPAVGSPTFSIQIADDSLLPAAPVAAAPIVAAAQAAADAQKPITSDPVVAAAAFEAIDPAVSISPNTAAMQAACTAELEAMLAREATPGGTVTRARLQATLAATPGLVDFTLTAPAVDFAPAGGAVPYLGTPVYS